MISENLKNILIVEDEILTAMNLKMELENSGLYLCHHLSSGPDAVNYCISNEVDVIIMDLCLSGSMDGVGIISIIRKMKYVPVIFISGFTIEEMKMRAEGISGCTFLHKPVNHTLILKSISEIVKIR